jgi:CHAT domain-containing protein
MIQNNLGITYQQQVWGEPAENLELALNAYQNALTIYTPNTFPQEWARTQNNLGEAYRNRIYGERAENLEQAIACYHTALRVRQRETLPAQWAATQDNLGIAYTERLRGDRAENLQLAIAAFEQALQVRTYAALPQERAITENNLGIAYRESGQPAKAIASYQNSLQIRTREAMPVLWAQTQNNLGNAHLDLRQFSEALACYRAALSVRTLAAAPAECLITAKNLGHAAFLSERWNEAIEGYRLAVEAVESIRGWALTDRRRQEIQVAAMDAYAGAIQAYIKADRPDLSMEYAERSKARNLVERFASRTLYPKGNISPIVLQEFDRLRQEISREQFRIDMVEWQNTNYKNRSYFYELRRQLDKLLNEQIEPHDHDFSLTQRVEPISFTEIQALLEDRHTALIHWYVLGETFVTFIVTFDKSFPTVWKSSVEDKQALAQWTEEYLNAYYLQKAAWQSQLPAFLVRLAEILHLEDILACIPSSCDRLILIPHRGLHLFPLHALPVQVKQQPNDSGKCFEPPSLIDCFPAGVRYAPSCQLLQQAQARQRPCFERLFAIQNPTEDLDYTNVEIVAIQRYFQTSELLVKSAARKDAIKDEQFQVAHCVHFSCHGYFNAAQPLRSALLLADCYTASAPTNSDPADYLLLPDGRAIVLNECLTLDGIFVKDLSQCRLVSLSACETGMTDSTALSDEYIGLPSGFLVAGSASVVSSLWTVNDLSTAFLMVKFYQNLQGQTSVAIALNQAQIWLRNLTKKELQEWISENKISLDATLNISLRRRLHNISDNEQPFKSPFHWAAFCAIGQ